MTSRRAAARETARRLAGFGTFATCSAHDLQSLALAGSPFSVPPAWSFLAEGIPADFCYVIIDGTARVYRGREQIGAAAGGDIVGEMALITGAQRNATVTSVTKLHGLRVELTALSQLISANPRIRQVVSNAYRRHSAALV